MVLMVGHASTHHFAARLRSLGYKAGYTFLDETSIQSTMQPIPKWNDFKMKRTFYEDYGG